VRKKYYQDLLTDTEILFDIEDRDYMLSFLVDNIIEKVIRLSVLVIDGGNLVVEQDRVLLGIQGHIESFQGRVKPRNNRLHTLALAEYSLVSNRFNISVIIFSKNALLVLYYLQELLEYLLVPELFPCQVGEKGGEIFLGELTAAPGIE
jgi:hypothetical protein